MLSDSFFRRSIEALSVFFRNFASSNIPPVFHKYRFLLTLLVACTAVCALAESYDSMWKKAQKAKDEKQYARAHEIIDKVYDRALHDGNSRQLARVLFAYDALNVQLTEDSIISNAHRIWDARHKERNATEHVLLTHILGRLTDSDYLLALSVADTTFLQEQPISQYLPLLGEGTLYDIFTEYINERDLPDSVFVGWESPSIEQPTAGTARKTYDFSAATAPKTNVPAAPVPTAPQTTAPPTKPTAAPAKPATNTATAQAAPSAPKPVSQPSTPKSENMPPSSPPKEDAPKTAQSHAEHAPGGVGVNLPLSSGSYSAFVFNVPEGFSRICLVESGSGTPVKRWSLKRDDGHGQVNDITADGNGHIWQRPTQIHNYGGLFDWHLSPLTSDEAQVNTLVANDFHSGDTWGNTAIHDDSQLKIDMESADKRSGTYSFTVRAPHRNITLMRDVTSGGKLIEQRQYAFSDFIHFNMTWKETYGDKALVTFAYVFQGRLYETQMTITRPEQ